MLVLNDSVYFDNVDIVAFEYLIVSLFWNVWKGLLILTYYQMPGQTKALMRYLHFFFFWIIYVLFSYLIFLKRLIYLFADLWNYYYQSPEIYFVFFSGFEVLFRNCCIYLLFFSFLFFSYLKLWLVNSFVLFWYMYLKIPVNYPGRVFFRSVCYPIHKHERMQ